MRIGWVRAAPDVIRSLVAARAYADLGTPVLEQLGRQLAVGDRRLGRRPWRCAARQARENRDALVAARAPGAARLGVRGAAAAG